MPDAEPSSPGRSSRSTTAASPASSARWADATSTALVDHDDVDGACRRCVEASGEAGWLRGRRARGLWRAASALRRAHAVPRPRDARPIRDGLADFAFAMQGLGTGPITLFGSDGAEARAICRRSRAARRSPPSRCPSPRPARTSPRSRTTATPDGADARAPRRQKTWISNGGIADHYVVFARTGEAPGAQGLSAFVVDADAPGLDRRGAHRGDRAASARDAALRRLPRAAGAAARRAGRGLQDRDGDARRVPLDRRRRGARLRAPRARRGARARRDAPAVRRAAGRPPADARRARRHGDGGRCGGAARLPRRLDEGPAAPRGSRARPRWRRCTRPRRRSA